MRLTLAVFATALTMLALDLLWIGWIAAPAYAWLGPLKAPEPDFLAAALFYVMYVGAIVVHAVGPADSVGAAVRRGAGLGFVCYATYELTNRAVIAGWPWALVPIDIAWGVLLTGVAAGVGRAVRG